jgi:hypothetical protein
MVMVDAGGRKVEGVCRIDADGRVTRLEGVHGLNGICPRPWRIIKDCRSLFSLERLPFTPAPPEPKSLSQ